MKLDTRKPVALKDTFMARKEATNYIEVLADELSDGRTIRVMDECVNTGTREPAERLRRKIVNILPDMEGPLTIDFDGAASASSSFLDELIGRLVAELGKEAFDRQIRLTGMSEELVDMANVVVGMRVG